ncbi:MAG: NAD(P)H-hydrate epimerase [Chloroflexi bacterium]|nr:NAD(P)H-hydrate epimerase [Chloroflexota bacterium]
MPRATTPRRPIRVAEPIVERASSVRPPTVDRALPLPGDDPTLFELDLPGLAARWTEAMHRSPMSAEAMTGADRRAQALGMPGSTLMEHAGTAVAAVTRAFAERTERWGSGPILVLCGPGNNGGDGFVASRRLGRLGARVVVVFVASEGRPAGRASGPNWDRLAGEPNVERIHAPVARDLAILGQGIENVAIVVDALLGTGVRGALREPIRSGVELIRRAREAGVPVVAVDTPTAIDLTSGEISDPVVRADVTVTFHRPKVGLRTRRGATFAGRVLVAPIGIPAEADRG